MTDLELPMVTREEFDQITCNRCGDCCEAFWFEGPLEVAAALGKLAHDRINYSTEELLGWGLSIEDIVDGDCLINWYNSLVPTGVEVDGRYQYSCTHFRRLSPDFGECTIWPRRPRICSTFPYGQPMPEFKRCSWAVKIINEA